MCGIVGIYLKSKKFENSLGGMLSDMLINMGSRGPDSAGFAVYKEDEDENFKYSLFLNNTDYEKFRTLALSYGEKYKVQFNKKTIAKNIINIYNKSLD